MSNAKAYALGIDLGGTKIMVAVVDIASGEVIASARKKTHAERGQEFIIQRIIDLANTALAEASVDGQLVAVGVGSAGQIDRANGVVLESPNLGVRNLALGEILSSCFHKPVAIGNDVEVATLGEQLYGVGKGYETLICIFVGTGIGSGMILDGALYTGHNGTAGEIGHMIIQAGGRICGCGARGCLEAYASRTAMTKALIGEIRHGRPSVLAEEVIAQLKDGEPIIRSGMLASAIKKRDALTVEIVSEAAEYLGIGLGSILNIYNPEAIILGGGVVEAIDLFYEVAVHRARNTALSGPRQTPIHRAKLGDFAGVVGAAFLAAQAARHR